MSEISFLNVDLDLQSSKDLTPIINDFGEDVIVLHHGKMMEHHHASFEVAESFAGPNELISFFCTLVENLSEEARVIWDNCCIRRFDLGYESGQQPRCWHSEITAKTIARVNDVGASITITIYPLPG
jgi:hypothetical protein